MKYYKILLPLFFTGLFIIGCKNNSPVNEKKNDLSIIPNDSTSFYDSATSVIETKLPGNFKVIKENFKRINAIARWSEIKTKELWESLEGGEAKFYYQDTTLEKIVTWHFGESYRYLIEYYLMNGHLSFVFEKEYRYNRPIFYDTAAMKENNDTEVFDFKKSIITETRSYFENKKLTCRLSNREKDSSYNKSVYGEQERLMTAFVDLVALSRQEE